YAITLDIMMPNTDGWTVLEALKSDPETRHIPVLVCSIVQDEDKGYTLGATDYLVKPILEEDLVHALQRLEKHGPIQQILAVDDSDDDLRLVERIIEEHTNYEVIPAPGGQAALNVLQSTVPDAIILDLYMPDLDGFTLLETIRNDPKLQHLPVIILTGGDLTDEQRAMLKEKSQALLHKAELKEEDFLKELQSLLQRLNGAETP
ncbi:MAG: response regulator, partial [Anaerolineae bacterium]